MENDVVGKHSRKPKKCGRAERLNATRADRNKRTRTYGRSRNVIEYHFFSAAAGCCCQTISEARYVITAGEFCVFFLFLIWAKSAYVNIPLARFFVLELPRDLVFRGKRARPEPNQLVSPNREGREKTLTTAARNILKIVFTHIRTFNGFFRWKSTFLVANNFSSNKNEKNKIQMTRRRKSC